MAEARVLADRVVVVDSGSTDATLAILDAAVECFVKIGYPATTTAKIASRMSSSV